MTDTARAAEAIARASYGRLVGILASRSRDIASAEDALSDAFAKALSTWPKSGIPNAPEAWLLTTARNRLTDVQRRDARLRPEQEIPVETTETHIDERDDARLQLMFVCAHPAIDRSVHTPLMLQTVLGFDARAIAQAFVTFPAAMAQRLVRAKSKIKSAGIAFQLPDQVDRPTRLSAVLEAIYGAYALDWLENSDRFSGEAQYLAEVLAHAMPQEAEALGLVALIAFGRSRHAARVQNGRLVPVHEQDPALWNDQLIDAGAHYLSRASKLGSLGRFQIEAALQSVHAHRKVTGITNWSALLQLYDGLLRISPTLGARVARAAALGQVSGANAALDDLAALPKEQLAGFQPYFATLAHFLSESGQTQSALSAYEKAISLSTDAISRRYLEDQCANLRKI